MKRIQNQIFAIRVINFYQNYAHENLKNTVKHFIEEGHSKSTIYGIISRFKKIGSGSYKKITGRKLRKKRLRMVENYFYKYPKSSLSEAAKI